MYTKCHPAQSLQSLASCLWACASSCHLWWRSTHWFGCCIAKACGARLDWSRWYIHLSRWYTPIYTAWMFWNVLRCFLYTLCGLTKLSGNRLQYATMLRTAVAPNSFDFFIVSSVIQRPWTSFCLLSIFSRIRVTFWRKVAWSMFDLSIVHHGIYKHYI